MATPKNLRKRITKLDWKGLQDLWENVKARNTPGWELGRAFEYLIMRMFELDKATVRWAYPVSLFGEQIEQIDGSIRANGLYGLVECKDEAENVAIGPIAKLRNQLLRRPAGTVGLLFSSGGFTDPAIHLAHLTLPQAILLWSGDEVEYCLRKRQICRFCELKYRACVDFGIPDFDVRSGDEP